MLTYWHAYINATILKFSLLQYEVLKVKNECIEEVINLLPSNELRTILLQSLPDWTAIQTATLAFRYMGKHKFSKFLRKLAQETNISEERGLLLSASHDVRQHSFRRYGFSVNTEVSFKR